MPVIETSFKGVHGSRETLPVGVYLATIADITQAVSRNKNALLRWRYSVSDGEFEGLSCFQQTMLEPATALFSLKDNLLVLGEDPKVLSGDNFSFDTDDFIGRQVGVVIVPQSQDPSRTTVDRIVPVEEITTVLARLEAYPQGPRGLGAVPSFEDADVEDLFNINGDASKE